MGYVLEHGSEQQGRRQDGGRGPGVHREGSDGVWEGTERVLTGVLEQRERAVTGV